MDPHPGKKTSGLKKQVTIHDIARKLGLSASTVSRALNHNRRISKKTTELVWKTAEAMNYRHNAIASSLRTGKAHSIGLIVPKINRFFFADTIAGIESVTNPAGYNLIICQSAEQVQREVESLKALVKSRVDGIIISVSAETVQGDYLQGVIDKGIPLVQFDRVLEQIDCGKVLNTNREGAYEAACHLIEKGYRKVGCFTGPRHLNIYRERFEGYREALADHQIPFREQIVFEGDLTYSFGYETCMRLKDRDIPQAFFSAGDFSALGALQAMKERKISVPEQVGLTGFANEQVTHYCHPGISSVDQFGFSLGEKAARLLLKHIEKEPLTRDQLVIRVPTKLVIRDSSCKTALG